MTGAVSHSDQSKQEPKRRSVCGWRFGYVLGGGWLWWLGLLEGGWALRLYDALDENKHVHLRPDDARDMSRSLVEMKHAESRPRQRPPRRRPPPCLLAHSLGPSPASYYSLKTAARHHARLQPSGNLEMSRLCRHRQRHTESQWWLRKKRVRVVNWATLIT